MFLWQQSLCTQTSVRILVAGSTGRLQYSLDGGRSLTSVAHGQGTSSFRNFVHLADRSILVSASNGRILRSTNEGHQWSVWSTLPAGSGNLLSIAYVPATNLYVAVTVGTNSSNRCWTSPTGGTWTAITCNAAVDSISARPAVYGSTVVFAASANYQNVLVVDTQARTATSTTVGFGSTATGVFTVYVRQGIWYAGGQGFKVSSSPAGTNGIPTTWTLRSPANNNNNQLEAFTYDAVASRYIGIGSNAAAGGGLVSKSTSGTSSWTEQAVSGLPAGAYARVTSDGPTKIVGLTNGGMAVTSDWITYTPIQGSNNWIYDIVELVD